MIFNSWEYFVFFAGVFALYNVLPKYTLQNFLLIVASYYFYAAWDWRLCVIPFVGTVVNYFAGSWIYDAVRPERKRLWLVMSVTANLCILCFFKYYNFFLGSLEPLLSGFGTSVKSLRLHLVLPVGISFYTFLVMTYTIDIYRGRMKPTRNFLDFAVYVSFFPQLLAGPITRARALLPQISRVRRLSVENFESGCWLIFWGLYKKIFIADNMAALVDVVFANSMSATLAETYLGALAFTVQIYCDFSGYSDIARGCARLLGFELMRNFNLPYFAKNPRAFWHRWHISLSTWLRDYLYIPLGGNRKGESRTCVNLFLTMVLGGLWHGASWNYVVWGAYHGLLLIGHRLISGAKKAGRSPGRALKKFVGPLVMFQFTVFGWLLFRSNRWVFEGEWGQDNSLAQIGELLMSYRNGLGLTESAGEFLFKIVAFTVPLAIVQSLEVTYKNYYFMLGWTTALGRAAYYGAFVFMLLLWGVQTGETFVYFQF